MFLHVIPSYMNIFDAKRGSWCMILTFLWQNPLDFGKVLTVWNCPWPWWMILIFLWKDPWNFEKVLNSLIMSSKLILSCTIQLFLECSPLFTNIGNRCPIIQKAPYISPHTQYEVLFSPLKFIFQNFFLNSRNFLLSCVIVLPVFFSW